jgi:glutamate/aspartate transport system substrate-binding protein
MKKIIYFFICIISIFNANAQVESITLSRIKNTGIVKIGVRTNADPFSFYQESQGNGYIVELCNIIVEDLQKNFNKKLSIQYVPVNPSNRFELIQSGQIDLECGTTTVNKERREKADFSYNTFITSTNFVTLSKNKFDSPKDIYKYLIDKNQKIAIMKGTSHEEMIQHITLGRSFNVLYVNSIEEGLNKVVNGEVFAFVQDKALIEKGISNLKLDKKMFAFSQEPLSIEPYSIMIQKGDKEMVSFVNSSLKNSYSSGQALKLMNKWLQPKQIEINFLTSDNFKMPSTENAVN